MERESVDRKVRSGLAVLITLILLVGCGADAPPGAVDPNSMQAIQDAIRVKESHPGKTHYDQVCATCHNGTVKKAPHREMIGLMTPESIYATLNRGVMQTEGAGLTVDEKIAVSEYLAGSSFGEDIGTIPACSSGQAFDPTKQPRSSAWGFEVTNTRHIEAAAAGIERKTLADLTPRWSVGFPGANRARSQPAFAGGLLFVGSHNGRVYALDQDSGCEVWSFQAAAEVRTGILVEPSGSETAPIHVFFGDVLGNAYALDAFDGALQWRVRVDDHPNATITAAPTYHDGVLFVPISALEVSLAIDPHYPCCSFRGSILALHGATGETKWRAYTIDQPATEQKKNAAGTPMLGPSGAVVWNTPSIDVKRGQLYFGTGENMSSPATDTSDALFALDMHTGAVKWVFQATAGDAWNVACDTDTPDNCPSEDGPDFDFGGPTILVNSASHGDLVVAGQKSGYVHAIDPDTGDLVWQTRVGRGGIQGGIHFGMAAAGQRLFVPISDMSDGRTYEFPDRPGMHALDINTGQLLWSTIHADRCEGRAFCHPGISQVPSVIGDVVIAGAMDGWLRAYAVDSGEVVWQLDSTQEYESVSSKPARGGSFGGAAGPVALNGKLVLSSGYGIYNHMPGNLLLVLE